jgi:sialate O-acetylesterase
MNPTLRLVTLALVLAAPAMAETRMPAIFGEGMVLQHGKPLPIWGWDTPGKTVTVQLGRTKAETTTGPDGRWSVTLPAREVSKDPLTLAATGSNALSFENILVGDVWICSGQSNMDWALHSSDAAADIAAADFPLIRHFRTEYHFATSPQQDLKGRWAVCTPGNAPNFSAVGFYFARRVQEQTGIPIGLITNAVGGTNIELWMSQQTLLGTPELEPYANLMRESLKQYEAELAAALPSIEQWAAAARAATAQGQAIPHPPKWPEFPFAERVARPRCVTLHNGHVAPLIPMAVRGVLWYQGESNADDRLYLEKKRAMVNHWRQAFNHPELPFYYVQLAAWQAADDNPAGGGWGMIRDIQRQCLAIPHTGMASAVDVGDADDIHPRNKADVGERLALWAIKHQYNHPDTVASGPLFREMSVEGDRIRLRFDSVGGGLMAGKKDGRQPAVEDPGAALRRFAIAGEDRNWEWADARIVDDTVVLGSPQVPKPVAVRYAYASNPDGANLYNREGLPASPFRTDDW